MMNALAKGLANKSLKRMILDGTKVGAYELLKDISRQREQIKMRKVVSSKSRCKLRIKR